ncbi:MULTISPECIES: hypothetical protein [unclassified Leclercia]|uniref:AP2/ERF domain-containing protein n=1 Tax=Leclercia barmai TaxID=2785629 RepID=A0ABS7RT12_9ENTR|nr:MULTISPECIES: hypothetical protein [unclassified Leclercia]MBZ0057460.1 hypothetical protein [Leclercia sp. EMC7]MCM5695624.1 hypothetical protein [Leclercia sp. LTM01]MCM5700032.1 hypothetical protein [Leclercia sp. LTM14]
MLKSKLNGVTVSNKGRVFTATLRMGQDSMPLGQFKTERLAAETHDLAMLALYGDQAITNYPRQKYTTEQIRNMSDFIDRRMAARENSPSFSQLSKQAPIQ